MKRTQLRPVSRKRQARLEQYRKAVEEQYRKLYWDGPSYCEWSKVNGLVEPHHPRGRSGSNLFIFVLISPILHRQIHENPNWARKMGYLHT